MATAAREDHYDGDGGGIGSHQDDLVLGFRTVRSGVMGRLVRMGTTADQILNRHDYPEAVGGALGEALVLATLLGAPLKEGAKLILQTKTDGPLRFLVCNYESPGRLRGYASFDGDAVASLVSQGGGQGRLIGRGHLAMTVDPGSERDRYQGIVGLENEPLEVAALNYFRQSEQLPTFLKLAVARQYVAGQGEDAGGWVWRAGGLLVQHLSPLGGGTTEAEAEAEELEMLGEEDDHWQRVRMLAETVELHELIDPSLSADALLFRLFGEEGVVRAVDPTPLVPHCGCSRERVTVILKTFGRDELEDMREDDGKVSVRCEFCTNEYRFDLDEIG